MQKLLAFSGLYLYQVHVFLHTSELPLLFAVTIQGSPFTLPFVLCSWSCSITCKAWNSHFLLILSPFPESSLPPPSSPHLWYLFLKLLLNFVSPVLHYLHNFIHKFQVLPQNICKLQRKTVSKCRAGEQRSKIKLIAA